MSERPLEAFRWRSNALCRSFPVDLFFDEESEAEAKQICSKCEVWQECRIFANDYLRRYGELHGVWGGLNETERNERS